MPRTPQAIYLCLFSGTAFDALTVRDRRDYEKVKTAIIEDGRFSVFDATERPATARIFDRLGRDPEVVFDHTVQFPWMSVRRA
jgi:hypothetical protein